MVFSNGSSLVSLSAQKGRGRTADRVILDEMAFYTLRRAKIQLAEVMKSIAPTLERSQGQMVGITTGNGRGQHYSMWMDAINGISKFMTFFVSCWDDPDFDEQSPHRSVDSLLDRRILVVSRHQSASVAVSG